MNRPLTFVCAALLGAATLAPAQSVRIGYVDMSRLESESVQAKRAVEALKKEFAPREKQILDLQKQIEADRAQFDKERDKLPPSELKTRGNTIAEMMRRSDQMAYALADDIERRKNERTAKVIEETDAAIKAVAEAGKYDLILHQAVYRRPAVDITDQILKEMAKRAGAGTGS